MGTMYGPRATARIGPGGNVAMKRSQMSLDFSRQAGVPSKKPRLGPLPPSALSGLTPLLGSPDLMKLGSPEFEKLLIAQQDGLMTVPTPYFKEQEVTEEQELYAQGFVEALNELHHSDSSQEPGSVHEAIYTTLEPPGSVQSTTDSMLSGNGGMMQIKDEPQTVPSVSSSPPMSPIDMESQERIKLERKRQRNRVAASKCRRRKLERISRLEDKVRLLKGENTDLSGVVNRLRDAVSRLKEQVIDHMHSGCQISPVPGLF